MGRRRPRLPEYRSPFLIGWDSGLDADHSDWIHQRDVFVQNGDETSYKAMLSHVTLDNPPLASWPRERNCRTISGVYPALALTAWTASCIFLGLDTAHSLLSWPVGLVLFFSIVVIVSVRRWLWECLCLR